MWLNAVHCQLEFYNMDHIISFGTCGAINPTFENGRVVIPDRFVTG